ncbi:MAG: helix-turn-helix domain-containing protein [Halocynthiibacter sp.]
MKLTNSSDNNLSKNLRLLCMQEGSISAAATGLGINRQQINKYLGGTSKPSLATIKKICDFFDIDETEIFLPHDELKTIISAKTKSPSIPRELINTFASIQRSVTKGSPHFKSFLGKYFQYTISRNPPMINRALSLVTHKNGYSYASTLERYLLPAESASKVLTHRYESLFLPVGDRISLISVENPDTPHMTISTSIFYPTSFPKEDIITGKHVTVSNFGSRPIYTSPIVLEYLGDTPTTRLDLSALGFLPPNTPKIRPRITEYLMKNYQNQW